MNGDWIPCPLDSLRVVTIYLHSSASPFEVAQGLSASAFDLSPFVSRCTQGAQEVSVTLNWHHELDTTHQPVPGQVLEVCLNGKTFWIGLIQAISDYTQAVGTRTLNLTARTRDASPTWRDVRRGTDVFPLGISLNAIINDIAAGLGLDPSENRVPALSLYTVHNNSQLEDLTPWQMLTLLMQPAGYAPLIDAKGRLKALSRNTQRASDIVLTDHTRLLSLGAGQQRPPVSEITVSWLNPVLVKVSQVDKVLANASITAGFFQMTQKKKVTFSSDGTQRAENTHLVIKQSANSGLLPVCKEDYSQFTLFDGQIKLSTYKWVPLLTTALLATKLIAHQQPDGVSTAPGVTTPIGRIAEGIIDITILLILMSIGTGHYEVWGTPYDYVHARNRSTAFNSQTKAWEIQSREIENDFVMDEAGAQSLAITELIYAHREASARDLTLVDDPRIEVGDIIETADGTRVYVTDYTRTLTPGAPATLNLSGFRC